MSNFLEKICISKKSHVLKRKREVSLESLELQCQSVSAPRGFVEKLKITEGSYGLIAEIKKASPSKGLIRENFDPALIAAQYERGGANCLSVLTDIEYFQGDDSFLPLAREAVSLPVLRKDFILDPYQIIESRALGADCILLIMAVLSDDQAMELEGLALKLNLDVLLEVHNNDELDRALKLNSKFIGINNRNLRTFAVDIEMTRILAPRIPKDTLVVSESGLYTSAHLAKMSAVGVNSFLIGEAFMRANDIEYAVRNILSLNSLK